MGLEPATAGIPTAILTEAESARLDEMLAELIRWGEAEFGKPGTLVRTVLTTDNCQT